MTDALGIMAIGFVTEMKDGRTQQSRAQEPQRCGWNRVAERDVAAFGHDSANSYSKPDSLAGTAAAKCPFEIHDLAL